MLRLAAPLALALVLAGCVQAGVDLIERARDDADERRGVEEATDGGAPTPLPTTAPTRAPASPPATPPGSAPGTLPGGAPTAPGGSAPAPTPAPVPGPAPAPVRGWPVAGSEVRLAIAGAAYRAWANWTYDGDEWRGACEGVRMEDGRAERFGATFTPADPPHWPLLGTLSPPAVGERVEVWWMEECRIVSGFASYRGEEEGRHAAGGSGDGLAFATSWDARTGLVTSWDLAGNATRASSGRLAATDAPLED